MWTDLRRKEKVFTQKQNNQNLKTHKITKNHIVVKVNK